jgi:hypothetical protein
MICALSGENYEYDEARHYRHPGFVDLLACLRRNGAAGSGRPIHRSI